MTGARIAALLTKDARGIFRDRLLAPLAFYPLVLALVMRYAVTWIPIEHVEVYAAPFVVTLSPQILGFIFGYSLIEEREQGTWLLLRVVPLSQTTLLGYLVIMTSGFSFVVSLLSVLIYGLPIAHPLSFVALTAIAGLLAPLLAFAMAAIATNTVQGFTLGKALANLPTLALLVFVLPVPWQVTLWWNPSYWLYVGLARAYAGGERLGTLAGAWPRSPDWLIGAASLALCLAGIWIAGSAYRRRTE